MFSVGACRHLHAFCCREIPDEEATKPEGWLDDEPAEVDDPGEAPAALSICPKLCLVCRE
jgi:hypothetical protein